MSDRKSHSYDARNDFKHLQSYNYKEKNIVCITLYAILHHRTTKLPCLFLIKRPLFLHRQDKTAELQWLRQQASLCNACMCLSLQEPGVLGLPTGAHDQGYVEVAAGKFGQCCLWPRGKLQASTDTRRNTRLYKHTSKSAHILAQVSCK